MTTTDEVRDALAAAIAALPDTADGIAAFLVERGIQPTADSDSKEWCYGCPLAVFFEREIGRSVFVTACSVVVPGLPYPSEGPSNPPAWDLTHGLPLPVAVSAFIGRIDRDEYPALVRP